MKTKKKEVRQKWPTQLELDALTILDEESCNGRPELTSNRFIVPSLLSACNNRGEYQIGDKKRRIVHAVYFGGAYMGGCPPHALGELIVLRRYLTFEEYLKLGKPKKINLDLVHTSAD